MSFSVQTQTLPGDLPPPMLLALCSSFGSLAAWRQSFEAMAHCHAAQAGRVEMAFSPADGALVHRWNAGGGAVATVLALQLPGDVDAFIAGIDWPQAYQRYQHAVHAASEGHGARHGEVGGALLLDVRRAGVFEAATTLLPGAVWRDPARVNDWARELPAGREVVVYCVYGHEVGRATAMRLRALGVQARYLSGGIDAWQGEGRPTVAKGAAS